MQSGLLQVGDVLTSIRTAVESVAEIDDNSQLLVNDVAHSTPSGAAMAAAGTTSENGWQFWEVEREGSLVSLDALRVHYRLNN